MKIVLISLMLVGATLSAQAAEVSDPAFHDFVYASVLDGLRQEKLPAEVVDRVLAVDAKSGLYVSFLKKCPVCEPVREAFAAYRKEAAGGAPEELVVALSQESDLKRTKAV
ncbi:MAG: hypothetical protein FJX76_20950, partial [Armatimonadetes bacterium]|nr:hypothetical protein [Armatimonadota bacterium]